MKKKYISVSVIICAALAGGMWLNSCGHSEHDGHDIESHEGHEGHDHDAEDHDHDAEDHHDHDGEEGHSHGPLIELKESVSKRFGVMSERIDPSDFSEVTVVSGKIESKASDEGVATATRSGVITLMPDINTGVRVSAGSAIASISPSNVQGSDPMLQAKASRDAAKRELDRLEPLHKDGIVSTEVYNNALKAYEEADAALRSSGQGSGRIVSPKNGVITSLLVRTGEYVEAGQRIATVSGNTKLTLRAEVPEKYIGRLSAVESANFRPASSDKTYSLEELDGNIMTNASSSVSENGYIPVFFSFSNNGEIAPGAFAEVFLKSGLRHNVLSLPKEAIVEINGNKCVYAKHGEGHYVKHVVTTGNSDGKRIEIVSGIEPGEEIVVKGAQVVRMAETSATAVPGHTHNH